jgi:tyrocidine synthetase III
VTISSEGRKQKIAEDYWLRKLKGVQAHPFFIKESGTTESSRPALELQSRLAPPLIERLAVVSSGDASQEFLLLLAALQIALYRYVRASDFVLLTACRNASSPDGCEPGPVFFRTAIDATRTAAQLLIDIQADWADIRQVSEGEMSRLLHKYALLQLGDVGALFQCGFYYARAHAVCARLNEAGVFFQVFEDGRVQVNYDRNLSQRAFVPLLAQHFLDVLEGILEDPSKTIRQLNAPTAREKNQLMFDLSRSPSPAATTGTLVNLFEARVEKAPEAIAAIYGRRQWSYKALNEVANRVAHYLRDTFNLQPEDLVGIFMERSEWLVIAILGVLKSSAGYVPIHTEFPPERIASMLEDKPCRLVLTDKANMHRLRQCRVTVPVIVAADIEGSQVGNPVAINSPGDLAIVIYTSGSTGQPAGVILQHDQLANKVVTITNYLGFDETLRCMLLAFSTSDAAVYQIFMTLIAGGCLILIDTDQQNDPGAFWQLLSQYEINLVNCVPSFMAAMLNDPRHLETIHIKYLMFGGDVVPPSLAQRARQLLSFERLFNLYGPTEITIEAAMYECRPDAALRIVPIGRPSPSYQVFILDEEGECVPIGVHGEIYIGGPGVARGYLNNVGLTLERFIASPFGKGERLYRTGDWGRYLPDGNIEFLGRNDNQLKLRGHRVEVAEVENQLMKIPGVTGAVVQARAATDDDKVLVAYLETTDHLNPALITNNLRRSLPTYMIPSLYVAVDSLPLTPNGKVDRKALLRQTPSESTSATGTSAPRNDIEADLLAIWRELLPGNQIGIHDNFFDLGGHSLKATQMVSHIHKKMGAEVRLKQVFTRPTIAELASLIAASSGSAFVEIPATPASKHAPLSHAQRRVWVVDQTGDGDTLPFNMPMAYLLEGAVDAGALERALETVVERHESLRTTFLVCDGEPRQQIDSSPGCPLERRDFSLTANPQERIDAEVQDLASFCFDLASGPLLKAKLLKRSEDNYVLAYVMHHIISDAWSMEVFAKEFFYLYAAYLKHGYHRLPPPRIQYRDYIAWQNALLKSSEGLRHRDYWFGCLSGELPVLRLLTDYPRPAIKASKGDSVEFMLSKEMTLGLRRVSREENLTLFMTLMATVKLLLHAYSDQPEIMIGTTVAGRNHIDLEGQIGIYINVLPIRTTIRSDDTARQYLRQVREVTFKAHDHQSYPLDALIEELGLGRGRGRSVLFDVIVNNVTGLGEIHVDGLTGLKVTPLPVDYKEASYDLIFNIRELDEQVVIRVDYDSGLFTSHTAMRLTEDYLALAGRIAKDPDKRIEQLSPLEPPEPVRLSGEEEGTFSFH